MLARRFMGPEEFEQVYDARRISRSPLDLRSLGAPGFLRVAPLVLGIAVAFAGATGCAATRKLGARLGLPGGGPRLVAARVEEVPLPDDMREMNTLWNRARPLVVTVRQPRTEAGRPVELRAIHDGRAIMFLAVWPDLSPLDGDRLEWVWDRDGRGYYGIENLADFFAIKFPMEGSGDACMMSGREGVFDVWQWRAGWTDVSGYADDRTLTLSLVAPEALAEAEATRAYPMASGPMHVIWREDDGDPPARVVPRPKEYAGRRIPGIEPQPPTGSRGDVRAAAVHQNGRWSLEIHRLLETANPDDRSLSGRSIPFAIAIGDDRQGQEHLTSEAIRLILD